MTTELKSEQDFEKLVLKNDKLVLLDFYADWCGPCKSLMPKLEELQSEYAEGLEIIKVNVDQAPELAGQYEVRGIPALFFFKDGEVQGILNGNQPKEVLKEHIEKYK